MPATAVIGVPLVLAVVVYVVFNWAGVKSIRRGSLPEVNLVPPGIPKPLYVLVIPIEFVSTFLLRPFTLAIRLMANMMSGHLLLVLFYSATSYFLLEAHGLMKRFGGRVLRRGLRVHPLRMPRHRAAGLHLHAPDRRLHRRSASAEH